MPKTRAERLMAVVEKMAPDAAAHYRATGGEWPVRTDLSRPAPSAPYTIEPLPGDRTRIRVINADGDVFSGVGATVEAAIAALETKAGLDPNV